MILHRFKRGDRARIRPDLIPPIGEKQDPSRVWHFYMDSTIGQVGIVRSVSEAPQVAENFQHVQVLFDRIEDRVTFSYTYSNFQLEPVVSSKKEDPNKCTCEIKLLLWEGCRCGAVAFEREAQKLAKIIQETKINNANP